MAELVADQIKKASAAAVTRWRVQHASTMEVWSRHGVPPGQEAPRTDRGMVFYLYCIMDFGAASIAQIGIFAC